MMKRYIFGVGLVSALLAACQIEVATSEVPAPTPEAVSPRAAYHGEAQPITITGKNFLPLVYQDLDQPDGLGVDAEFSASLGSTELAQVEYIDDEHLTAVVPAGISPGTYELTVETPRGLRGTLADAYTANQYQDPAISAVTPTDVVNDAATDVAVSGESFVVGQTAELIASDDSTIALSVADVVNASFTATVSAGTAAGIYGLRVERADGAEAVLASALTVWDAADLDVTAALSETAVATGQSFTLSVVVSNSGGSAAQAVTVDAPVQSGTGAATLDSGPLPASALLNPGDTQTFVFNYLAQSAGSLTFVATASGTNEHSLRAVSSDPATSDSLAIFQAALAWLVPVAVIPGQEFEATLTMTNDGSETVNGVAPTGFTIGGVTGTTCAGPVPVQADVPSSQTERFVYTCTAGATLGSLALTAGAEGVDALSGAAVVLPAVTSAPVTVQEASDLALAWLVPIAVPQGRAFSATLSVTNSGTGLVTAVTPSGFTVDGTTGTSCGAPSPASVDLAAGASQDFLFDCVAGTVLGSFTLTSGADGIDDASAGVISAVPATSAAVDVLPPADLELAWLVPVAVIPDQLFDATLSVTNVGAGAVNAISPTSFHVDGVSGTTCHGLAPAQLGLAAGQTMDFTYSCTAGATLGTFTMTAAAEGTDQVSGGINSAIPATSDAITIVEASDLALVWAVPAAVDQGRPFTATLSVTNNGTGAVNGVSPTSFHVGGTTGTTCTGPTPAVADLAAAASQDFVYDCSGGLVVGSLTLTAGAEGTDAATSGDIAAVPTTSAAVQIAPLLVLAVGWASVPSAVAPGVVFNPSVTIANTGSDGVDDAAPASFVLSGATGTSCTGPTPTAVHLPASSTAQHFVYTCTAGASPGRFHMSAGATGTDAPSGATVTAFAVDSADVTVMVPAALSLAWDVLTIVPESQAFNATLTATNDGEVGLTATAPTGLTITGSSSGSTGCTGPLPASADIAGGASQDYVWSCSASSAGDLTLSAGAQGSEQQTSRTVSAAPIDSAQITVLVPGSLSVLTVAASPTVVHQGEAGLAVSMQVENSGQTGVDVASDGSWLLFSRTGANVASDYSVTAAGGNPTSIAAAATELFNFTVDVAATARVGDIVIDGQASGTDAISALPVVDVGAQTTDGWTVIGAPTARVAVDLYVADVGASFGFDAGDSTDVQEATAALQVDYDWESDGIFDVSAGATETVSHSYASEGTFHVTARVHDTGGGEDYTSVTVVVAAASSTVTVSGTGSSDFNNALAAVPAGGVIKFDPAVFYPGSTQLSLGGGGPDDIDVDGLRIIGHPGVVISVTSDNKRLVVTGQDVVFANVEITGAGRYCVEWSGANSTIYNTEFSGCATAVTLSGSAGDIGPGNGFSGVGVALNISNGNDYDIHGNVFGSCTNDCVDIADSTTGHSLFQNLFYLGSGSGVVLGGSNNDSVLFYHNTFDGFGSYAIDMAGSNHEVINNIFSNNTDGAICDNGGALDAASYDYNDLFQNGTGSGCEPTGGADNISVDPLYTSLGAQDYSLQPDSLCIDAGTDLGLDVNGPWPGDYTDGPDLGAFETSAP